MINWFLDLTLFLSVLSAIAFIVSKSIRSKVYLGTLFLAFSALALVSYCIDQYRAQEFAQNFVGQYILRTGKSTLGNHSNFDDYENYILTIDGNGTLCFNKRLPLICGQCGKWEYIVMGETGYAEVIFGNRKKEQFGSTMDGGIVFRYPKPCEEFFQAEAIVFDRIIDYSK